MRLILFALSLITGRLRRCRWYLRLIDEDKAMEPSEEFFDGWRCKECESSAQLSARHDFIVARLKDDRDERRATLPNNFQAANVTLAAVSFFAAVAALVAKGVNLNSIHVKIVALSVISILWYVFAAYMPRLVKGFGSFMDAGVHAVQEAVCPTAEEIAGELYVGEASKLKYAASIIYELNVRNRIIRRSRMMLASAHLPIKLIIILRRALGYCFNDSRLASGVRGCGVVLSWAAPCANSSVSKYLSLFYA